MLAVTRSNKLAYDSLVATGRRAACNVFTRLGASVVNPHAHPLVI
jgi:hypothetical protein